MEAHLIHPNLHPRPLRRGSFEGEHFTLGRRELQGSFEVAYIFQKTEGRMGRSHRPYLLSIPSKYQFNAKLLLNLTCPDWFPQNICQKKTLPLAIHAPLRVGVTGGSVPSL